MSTLDVRYGRTKERRKRSTLLGLITAAAITLVMVLWVVWAGITDTTNSIEARTLSRDTLSSDHETLVTFEVSVHAQEAVDCAVQVVNDLNSPVGWKIVSVPTNEQRTQVVTVSVNTSEPAANGMVYRCWIP